MKKLNNISKVTKSYSFLSIMAMLLTSLSIGVLSILGVLSDYISFNALLISSICFGVLGVIGRFIRQDLDDDGKPFWDKE